jgi:hypothetical protein
MARTGEMGHLIVAEGVAHGECKARYLGLKVVKYLLIAVENAASIR